MEAENNSEMELTMQDVLEEEQELEEDAKAVLGDSDDKNCTYSGGYLARQALYACATCSSDAEMGGICLACSYACHEGHELFELYTKRNFRCDCGNRRFPNNRCRLNPDKDVENSENKYNQNFRGKYCTCSRPYPDLEDNTPDSMIQCIICEDWYHGRHLGSSGSESEEFGEMICSSCMKPHSFLYAYTTCFTSTSVKSKCDTKIESKATSSNHAADCAGEEIKKEGEAEKQNVQDDVKLDVKSEDSKQNGDVSKTNDPPTDEPNTTALGNESTEKVDVVNADEVKEVSADRKTESGDIEDCFYQKLSSFKNENVTGTVYWPEGWRKVLCKCSECFKIYESKQCSFLLDEGDTIHAYEERGKQRSGSESQYDKGWSALSSLDRVKQIEAVREYKNMEVQLKEYLRQFADNRQTVSKRDITNFFENIRSQKRQKVGNYVQTFCR